MRYSIKGKNITLADRTKEKISAKLDRIKKLFPEETTATVTVSAEKLDHKVEVTLPYGKRIVRAEAAAEDMMAAVDKIVDILEKQVVKYKKRLRSKVRQNVYFKEEYDAVLVDEATLDDEPVFKIERNKQFELRPMDAEEAVMQMELLGHNFFVFRNGETDDVNVVYKRKDGSFGLIEPEY